MRNKRRQTQLESSWFAASRRLSALHSSSLPGVMAEGNMWVQVRPDKSSEDSSMEVYCTYTNHSWHEVSELQIPERMWLYSCLGLTLSGCLLQAASRHNTGQKGPSSCWNCSSLLWHTSWWRMCGTPWYGDEGATMLFFPLLAFGCLDSTRMYVHKRLK